MAPPNEAHADRETIPAPAPSVFDDAPAWAVALYQSSEETRAALAEVGSVMHKLSYRMGALSIAMGLQEHRTREVEARVATVIPMRGN